MLISERQLLPCYEQGIVTADEVVVALIDRFCTRTFDSDAAGHDQALWDAAAREVAAALFAGT